MALERSRSGNGGHVWIFFAEPVPAGLARRLGAHLLTETMESNPDIGFESYDRFFPSQDTLPGGGFGNLIVVPLEHGPRQRGNSLFLDESFEPWSDQWAFLSSLRRLSLVEASEIVDEADRQGRVVGLSLPVDDEAEEPWTAPPSRRASLPRIAAPLPARVDAVLGDRIYLPRAGLPPALVNRLMRLAAFQNPAFYSAQAMRRSTVRHSPHRGLRRIALAPCGLAAGMSRGDGAAARRTWVLPYVCAMNAPPGILSRPPSSGTLRRSRQPQPMPCWRTRPGCWRQPPRSARRWSPRRSSPRAGTNALVLVHRRQLMDQWIARLGAFLDLPVAVVGQVGGGKRRPTGIVDVGVIQSLVRKGEVDDLVADYGHLVVDECHHVSDVSFEAVASRAKARFVLGLSATVTCKDGHHPIVFMQCGPVRFRTSAKAQARQRPFGHRALLRPTAFRMPEEMDQETPADPAGLCRPGRGRRSQRPDLRRCAADP